ncbi:MAG: hypothetical protein M1831_004490 [Alyxoria varia]|nr:MAG: hypothetical protein M1831_004490 [Alyxoria varia]
MTSNNKRKRAAATNDPSAGGGGSGSGHGAGTRKKRRNGLENVEEGSRARGSLPVNLEDYAECFLGDGGGGGGGAGGEGGEESTVEAVRYLQSVRSEALSIPDILSGSRTTTAAQPKESDDFTTAISGAYYSDGTCIAAPLNARTSVDDKNYGYEAASEDGEYDEYYDEEGEDEDYYLEEGDWNQENSDPTNQHHPSTLSEQDEEADRPVPAHHAYDHLLLQRHSQLHKRLTSILRKAHQYPKFDIPSIDYRSCAFDPSVNNDRKYLANVSPHDIEIRRWRHILKHDAPAPQQLARMPQGSVVTIIGILTPMIKWKRLIGGISGMKDADHAKDEDSQGATEWRHLATWAWSLLARLDHVGTLTSDEVYEVRCLGRKAAEIIRTVTDRMAWGEGEGAGKVDTSVAGSEENEDGEGEETTDDLDYDSDELVEHVEVSEGHGSDEYLEGRKRSGNLQIQQRRGEQRERRRRNTSSPLSSESPLDASMLMGERVSHRDEGQYMFDEEEAMPEDQPVLDKGEEQQQALQPAEATIRKSEEEGAKQESQPMLEGEAAPATSEPPSIQAENPQRQTSEKEMANGKNHPVLNGEEPAPPPSDAPLVQTNKQQRPRPHPSVEVDIPSPHAQTTMHPAYSHASTAKHPDIAAPEKPQNALITADSTNTTTDKQNPPAHHSPTDPSQLEEQQKRKSEKEKEREQAALAALDMIVLVVGEVFGQRDLLGVRERVWGAPGV